MTTKLDSDLPVLDLQKSRTQRIRVSHKFFKGVAYVDIRLWVAHASGEFIPTQQGISLRHEYLAPVIQGLMRAAREVSPP
jgi:hypothetical protein